MSNRYKNVGGALFLNSREATSHKKKVQSITDRERLNKSKDVSKKSAAINALDGNQVNQSVLSKIDGLMHGRPPRFCVVRTLGGLGDALIATPVLKELKGQYPDCHITYGTTKEYCGGVLFDILKNNPYIDELIPFQQANKDNYDLYLDITSTGVKDEYILKEPLDRQTIWGRAVGLREIHDGKCIYTIEEHEKTWAKDWIEDRKKVQKTRFVFIQPGSFADRRNWPRENMIALIDQLHKYDKDLVFIIHDYGVEEYKSKWSSLPNTHNISDLNIREIAALIDQCDLVVCHDSGMLHLAGALEKKIVSIFGSTHPKSRINWFKNCIAVWQKDLMCAPCVVGESRVLTSDGYKDIQDIIIGDIVKTVDGKYNKVTELHKNGREDRDLIELAYVGSNVPIVVTNDHKMLVSKNNTKVFRKKKYTPNPEWIESQYITEKDFLCIPKNKSQNIELEYDDPDMFWLYGLYIAEGYTHHRKTDKSRSYYTAFITSHEEAEFIKKRIQTLSDKYFGGNSISVTNNQDGSSKVAFYCKEFTEHIIKHFGKNKAIHKYIPTFIIQSSNINLKAFINGAMFGDGYSPEKGEHVYTTASRDLAYGFQELHTRFGILARVYERKRDTNYKKNTVIYRVYIGQSHLSTRWLADDDYIYTPVKNIKTSDRKDKFVYDITVENSTTFTINNVATWDCWYNNCNNHYYCMKGLPLADIYNASIYMLEDWDKGDAKELEKLNNVDYYYGFKHAALKDPNAYNAKEIFPVRRLTKDITKSKYKLSILMVTMDNYTYLKNTIDDVFKYTKDFELIIYQNARDNNSEVSKYLDKIDNENKKVSLVSNNKNAGFLEPNNIIAKRAKGEYICLLNDDMTLCKDWADVMIKALESNDTLAQVGPANTCVSLSHDGCGVPGDNPEYIEASCMVMPRNIYNEYGLFDDKNYHFAYNEDSDLSLRLREQGWNIGTVDIPIVHHRAKTSAVIQEDLYGIQAKNRSYFLSKWEKYLENRNFKYKIGIKRAGAIGDVLLATPIIEAIKYIYPLSNITMITSCPDVLEGNKFLHKVLPTANHNTFDIFFNLDNAYENIQDIHIVDAYANVCGLDKDNVGKVSLEPSNYDLGIEDEYVVFHPGGTSWVGRNWSQDRFDEIANRVKELGYSVVLIGDARVPEITCNLDLRGKTNIAQTAHIIAGAKLLVGIDSLPLHIAQSQNTPAVVFFGCVNPEYRIINDNVVGVNAKELACIGCHHWNNLHKNVTGVCVRADGEQCIEHVSVDKMFNEIKGVIDNDGTV